MKKRLWTIPIIAMLLVLGACNLNESTTPPEEGPKASITADVTSGEVPLTVTFDASGSTSPNKIISYSWNFGDGENEQGVKVTHTYKAVGEFLASVTVNDELNKTDVADVKITTSLGDTIYVDASYTGEKSNGSELEPYKTIEAAFEIAQTGQKVILKPATYSESVDMIEGVIFEGQSAEDVIINSGKEYGITLKGLSDATEIKNIKISGATQAAIFCENNSSPRISDCIFESNAVGIMCDNNSNPSVQKCTFTSNESAIRTFNNSSPEISECEFEENKKSLVIDNNSAPMILNNNIKSSTEHGIIVKKYSTPTLDGNYVFSSGVNGIYIQSFSQPTLSNNTFETSGESDVQCEDSNADFDDNGGNVISTCKKCGSCAEPIDVAGRYEGTGLKDGITTVLRAIEIKQEGENLSIKIFNQEGGVIPSNPNDSGTAVLPPGENKVTFTSTTREDSWELVFEEGGHISGTQILTKNSSTIVLSLDKK